jgi:Fe-S-cluster containining protein
LEKKEYIDNEGNFICEKCGGCCRKMKCIFLKENLCSVYENRPLICRIDKLAELTPHLKNKEKYFKMNKYYCRAFQEEDGFRNAKDA